MRIFLIILSIVLCVASAILNIMGFQGYLVGIEFYGINFIAELLLCALLGHFMFRTYANHKKSKKLTQELTNVQGNLQSLQAQLAQAKKAAQPVIINEVAQPQAPTAASATPAAKVTAAVQTSTATVQTPAAAKSGIIKGSAKKEAPISPRHMPGVKKKTDAKHQSLADEAAREAANCDTTALFKAFKG